MKDLPTFMELYKRYKTATQAFLTWVGKVEKNVNKNPNIPKVDAAISNLVIGVSKIGRSFLPEDTWSSFSIALSACNEAIKLRKQFGQKYYRSSNLEGDGHAFFIESLQKWHTSLLQIHSNLFGAEKYSSDDKKADSEDEVVYNFENFYSVLSNMDESDDEDQDDYYDDKPTSVPSEMKKGKAAKEKEVVDHAAAFEEDMYLFFLCSFYDLNDIISEVNNSWTEYKRERCSHLTAVIVTGAAIKMVKKIEASIQLAYPAVRDFSGFLTIVQRTPELRRLMENISSTLLSGNVVDIDSTAILFANLFSVGSNLSTFTTAIPSNGTVINLREGYFGPVYNEDQSPLGDMFMDGKRFLCQELAFLFNAAAASEFQLNWTSVRLNYKSSLPNEFFELLTDYFKTKHISLTLVFAVLCWLTSVKTIQGDGYLSKTVFLARERILQLKRRFERCEAQGQLAKDDKQLGTLVAAMKLQVTRDEKLFLSFCRSNPYLAGACLLDRQFVLMELGCHSLMITSRFRAFGHLYNAMLNRKLLNAVPLADDLVALFDRMIFFPSRPTAGMFLETYLLSSHVTAAGIKGMKAGRNMNASNGGIKKRRRMEAKDLSLVYSMLQADNYSFFYERQNSSNNNQHVLSFIFAAAQFEQERSGVLLLDVLAVNDFMTTLFERFRDELRLQARCTEFFINPPYENVSRDWLDKYVLEYVVIHPFITELDCVNDSSVFDVSLFVATVKEFMTSKDRSTAFNFSSITTGNEDALRSSFANFASKVASTIRASFNEQNPETRFFYSPRKLVNRLVREEFGSRSHHEYDSRVQEDVVVECFNDCMDILEENPRMTDEIRRTVKDMVKRQPGIVTQQSIITCEWEKRSGSTSVGSSVLCSILHHACSGNCKDFHLAHWLVCMGALQYSRSFMSCGPYGSGAQTYRRPEKDILHPVHCAIHQNDLPLLVMLTETENNDSLNLPVLETGDSPIHLALRLGFEEVAGYLKEKGCNLLLLNKRGETIFDVAATPSLKQHYRDCFMVAGGSLRRAQSYVPRSQTIFNMEEEQRRRAMDEQLAAQRQEAVNSQYGNHRGSKKEVQKPRPPTAEAEAAARKAEMELLAEYEKEKAEEAKKNQGKAPQGKKNKKKK